MYILLFSTLLSENSHSGHLTIFKGHCRYIDRIYLNIINSLTHQCWFQQSCQKLQWDARVVELFVSNWTNFQGFPLQLLYLWWNNQRDWYNFLWIPQNQFPILSSSLSHFLILSQCSWCVLRSWLPWHQGYHHHPMKECQILCFWLCIQNFSGQLYIKKNKNEIVSTRKYPLFR